MSAALEREIERLREENADLKRELGRLLSTERQLAFARRWNLSTGQARFLDVLYARPGRLITNDSLLYQVYPNGDYPDATIIKVYICNLRKKLGPGLIDTVWGSGYRLTPAGVAVCFDALGRRAA